ncbi:uncharacterized protein LOC129000263 [Macrosteles quadrilineatus]|uniref:uncharacterized protein LOC129000263 n=1 Tax=Macrosteles quadrilineatus TaxID=74068 RepID=UPI0023E339B7|nr:uncharacterized protein LOC129000263 [Macrosteles quadrilineatus]
MSLVRQQDGEDKLSGKSVPNTAKSHKTSSSQSRNRSVTEVVDELIKIQEEETAVIISYAQANALAEKAMAEAEAEKAMAEAEADKRLAQVQEEAKLKEIEVKKRLLEGRLSLLSKGSSRGSSKSSRRTLDSLLQEPISTKEGDVLCSPQDMQPKSQSYTNNNQFESNRNAVVNKGYLTNDEKSVRKKMPATVLSTLPSFSGNLDQWPAWIAEYNRSTELNDYTDLENLQRLQKSLSGKAKEMISALLIYPENVKEIINLLEKRFGRPEIIIKNLIASVRSRPPTKDYKPDTLVTFSDMVRNLVVTVKSLKQDHYLFNPQLMEELTDKLSTNMKLNWGMHVTSPQSQIKHPVGLDTFSTWLSSMADAATVCAAPSTSSLPGNYKSATSGNSNQKNYVLIQEESDKRPGKRMCLCCKKKEHCLEDCKQFLEYDVNKRWDTVKSCAKCRKRVACGVNGCTYSHHKLLHCLTKKEGENTKNPEPTEVQTEHVGYQEEAIARVLLRVLSVTLVGRNGVQIDTYALIDDGSTVSIIEKDLAEELGIEGPEKPISFSWTDGSVYTEEQSQTLSVTVLGETGEELLLDNVRTLRELQLPTQSISMEKMKRKWSHLQDIPEEVFRRGRPRLLIGHEHIHLTVPLQVVIGPANAPIALKSKLGWTINGPTGKSTYQTRVDKEFVMFKSEISSEMEELNSIVKRSFDTDFFDCSDYNCKKTEEEVRAETILENTCSQKEDGCWQVGLLWKKDNPHLPESRSVAWRRLNYVDEKMKENPKLSEQYHKQILSYAEKDYAEKLSPEKANNRSEKTWYLPHFSVINPRKPDKFRFVFDAASKSHGQSLNSYLLPGPNLFNSLIGILFQFRKHKIAFAADIEEMFLRIKIIAKDQDALRFLWRGENRNLEEWCMTSMIFGAVCSPTSAIYVMRKNAEKYGKENQEALHAIQEQFYMDDYLDSRETIDEAETLVKDVVNICQKGGFNLRNVISNSEELISSLPKSNGQAITRMKKWD